MRILFTLVAWLACGIGLMLLLGWYFALEVWPVPEDDPMLAASIAPTLAAGDVLLVWRGSSFARGNLLRCPDPQAPGRFVVARAMGAPGDRIDIKYETVLLDGRRSPSPRACEKVAYTMRDPRVNFDVDLACTVEDYGDMNFSALRSKDNPEPFTSAEVAPKTWFLVSDNRHIHVDSRDYGPLDPASCRHIVFRLAGPGGIADLKNQFSVVW